METYTISQFAKLLNLADRFNVDRGLLITSAIQIVPDNDPAGRACEFYPKTGYTIQIDPNGDSRS